VAEVVKLRSAPSSTVLSSNVGQSRRRVHFIDRNEDCLAALAEGEPFVGDTDDQRRTLPGPWVSVGVQVKTPLVGFHARAARKPGAREKVRVWGGRSASVARLVNIRRSPSLDCLVTPGGQDRAACSLR